MKCHFAKRKVCKKKSVLLNHSIAGQPQFGSCLFLSVSSTPFSFTSTDRTALPCRRKRTSTGGPLTDEENPQQCWSSSGHLETRVIREFQIAGWPIRKVVPDVGRSLCPQAYVGISTSVGVVIFQCHANSCIGPVSSPPNALICQTFISGTSVRAAEPSMHSGTMPLSGTINN